MNARGIRYAATSSLRIALSVGLCIGLLASPSWPCLEAVARADALHARLIVPAARDSLLEETRSRTKGELTAAGFRVTVRQDDTDAQAAIASAGAETHATAVVILAREDAVAGRAALVFWVYEPWGGRTTVVRSPIDAGDPGLSARRGAVQAVEILRAALGQHGLVPAAREQRGAGREPEAPAASDDTSRSSVLWGGVGLALWNGFDGLGSSLTPTLRIGLSLKAIAPALVPGDELALDVRAGAGGLAGASQLAREAGSVRLHQALVLGELLLRLWPRAALQPLVSLGGGAYLLSTEAEAAAPYVAHSARTVSGLLSAGAGLWFEASPHFATCLEAQLLLAGAPSDIRIAGVVEATAGAPMLLVGAQLMGGL